MVADPCCAIRFAGTEAVITLAFRTLVESAWPFQRMLVPELKPEPFTVRVKAALPATAEDGVRLVSVRLGVMVNGSGAGDVRPGTDTPTETVPGVAIRFAGMAAVSCEVETKVVLSGEPFQVS